MVGGRTLPPGLQAPHHGAHTYPLGSHSPLLPSPSLTHSFIHSFTTCLYINSIVLAPPTLLMAAPPGGALALHVASPVGLEAVLQARRYPSHFTNKAQRGTKKPRAHDHLPPLMPEFILHQDLFQSVWLGSSPGSHTCQLLGE